MNKKEIVYKYEQIFLDIYIFSIIMYYVLYFVSVRCVGKEAKFLINLFVEFLIFLQDLS